MRIAIVNTKGGVGKTTTAIYLAAGLHREGRTLLVDADRQQSAVLWSQEDPIWPFPVVARATTDVHRHLAGPRGRVRSRRGRHAARRYRA